MSTSRSRQGLQRLLLQVWSPAEVRDPTEPARHVDEPDEVCPHCGRQRGAHPVVRDPEIGSVMHCPGPAPT